MSDAFTGTKSCTGAHSLDDIERSGPRYAGKEVKEIAWNWSKTRPDSVTRVKYLSWAQSATLSVYLRTSSPLRAHKELIVIPSMMSVTGVKEWREGELRPFDDYLVGEEPLEIRVGDVAISVTMRTPGHDLELATGFLFTEGLISGRAQIASARYEPEAKQKGANCVRVDFAPGIVLDPEASRRNFYTSSSCGVCGKASINAVRVRRIEPPNPKCAVDPEVLCRLPDQLRAAQPIFSRTGGLHAAGLFSLSGELLALREDVGRHNAVDKVVGWALANDRVPLSDSLLMVSGRGGFETVQKALVAGVPVLASVSAPSDLAVNLAREFGMTLIGFLRGRRFVIYSGAQRLAAKLQLPR